MTEKFSAFDFLNQLLPGSLVTFFAAWLIRSIYPDVFESFNLGDAATTAVFIFASYFVGHLVNELGSSVFAAYSSFKDWKPWNETFLAQENMHEVLIKDASEKFGITISASPTAEEANQKNKAIDDYAEACINRLQQADQFGKCGAILNQFVFFRSATAAFLIMLIGSVVYALYVFSGNYHGTDKHGVAALVLFSIFGLYTAQAMTYKKDKLYLVHIWRSTFYFLKNNSQTK
jgi:hypothetical protein